MLLQLRSQINTRFGACWAWKLEHRVYMQLWWVRSNLRSPSMEHRVFTECTSSCGESDLTSTHPAWNTERTHPAVVSQILPPLTQHGTQSVHIQLWWVRSYLHSPSMEHRVYIQWCESDLTSMVNVNTWLWFVWLKSRNSKMSKWLCSWHQGKVNKWL